MSRVFAIAVMASMVAGCNFGLNSAAPHAAGPPEAARSIMKQPPYDTARWLYYVADRDSGEVLLSQRPDEMVFTGSTAKLFTIGTLYDTIGPDTRLTTPVYASAPPVDGLLRGNLILVASGDLALGGRGAMQGRVDQAFDATAVDHVYGDMGVDTRKVDDDPLAGLNDLARQVAAKGVRTIEGDVVIDTRLWQTSSGHEGPVPPIFVNDNILDIDVMPGQAGQLATVQLTPATTAFAVKSEVSTVAADKPASIDVSVDPANPRNLVVRGAVPEGKPQLTIYRVPDAATWARTLFIEALNRAGVLVTAPPFGPNNTGALPPADSYAVDRQLAALQSPPLNAFGKMILETSYNTGANAILCLLASKAGSKDCTDGLRTVRAAVEKAGLDSDAVVLTDGEGAYPASTTPKQITEWVRWAAGQSWGKAFIDAQPVLGETGTLAGVGANSPAKGKITAKTGTVAAGDPITGRVLFNVQSLAGYMQTDGGRNLVFAVAMSGATYPDVPTGIRQANDDVGMVAAALQQSLSK